MTDRVGTIPVAALGGETVTARQIRIVSAVARGENPDMHPMTRRALVHRLQILQPAEPPRGASSRRKLRAARRHELTDIGRAVLAEIGVAA